MYVHKGCPTPAARNWDGVLDGIYLNGSSPMSFNPSEFSKRDFVPDGDYHEGGVVSDFLSPLASHPLRVNEVDGVVGSH